MANAWPSNPLLYELENAFPKLEEWGSQVVQDRKPTATSTWPGNHSQSSLARESIPMPRGIEQPADTDSSPTTNSLGCVLYSH